MILPPAGLTILALSWTCLVGRMRRLAAIATGIGLISMFLLLGRAVLAFVLCEVAVNLVD